MQTFDPAEPDRGAEQIPDSPHAARPSQPPVIDERRGPRRVLSLLTDRTAVLVVGLCAGFAVGMSFAPAPSIQLADPGLAAAPADPVAAPPPPPAATPAIDPRVVARVRRTGKLTVGVFGDSFGIGVFDALYRLLPADQGYDVLKLGQEATGFTRYRVVNVEERARARLAADPVDVAVVSFGVNDAQDMWEGKLYSFMSDDWKRVVGERVDRLVAVAGSTGAPVFWIGLPAMRDPALDAKVRALDAFFADRVRQAGATFVETRALSVDAQGRYAAHLPDPASGVPRLMRTGDGIHMIGIGYQRIVQDAVGRISDYDRQVRAAAGATATGMGGR